MCAAPRLHLDALLAPGADIALPASAARHVQVLRLQPGAALTLFDGRGGEWAAEVLAIGRKDVSARVRMHCAIECELPLAVTLALAMPANERMDALVEKATELGVATVQPLLSERSVLRLQGERAARKREHWQAIAEAACEQCGRARVPQVAPVRTLAGWLAELPPRPRGRLLLSLRPGATALPMLAQQGLGSTELLTLSGPEGGLTTAEEDLALRAGFVALDLGPRVLRADTAPLAVLAWLALQVPRQPFGPD
jgi:16S rRNA (uracil1498-N3)-methyltransferase